jgi:hypothetical protein
MRTKLIAVASAAIIGLTAAAIPNTADARWRGGGGWWIPGAVVGGLALGAIASNAYRPYYGYGYNPYYYGGGGPYYGGPYYYGGGPTYYSGGPYYNGGPRYYSSGPYRHWTEY